MHHTKDKGDIGALKIQADLAEKGYKILIPLSEHLPFDFVIWKNGTFKTIQAKYRKVNSRGQLEVKFSTVWADKNGCHTNPMDKTLVDIVAIYCPSQDECYYVCPEDFKKGISLRVKEPLKYQPSICFASDYTALP